MWLTNELAARSCLKDQVPHDDIDLVRPHRLAKRVLLLEPNDKQTMCQRA